MSLLSQWLGDKTQRFATNLHAMTSAREKSWCLRHGKTEKSVNHIKPIFLLPPKQPFNQPICTLSLDLSHCHPYQRKIKKKMAVHIHNPNFFHTHHLRSHLTSSSPSPASDLFPRHIPTKFICKSSNKDVFFFLILLIKSFIKKKNLSESFLLVIGLSHWCSCLCWRWILF